MEEGSDRVRSRSFKVKERGGEYREMCLKRRTMGRNF